MIFIVFHGKEQIHAHAGKGITHHLPLIVLMILSTFVGALIVPPLQGCCRRQLNWRMVVC